MLGDVKLPKCTHPATLLPEPVVCALGHAAPSHLSPLLVGVGVSGKVSVSSTFVFIVPGIGGTQRGSTFLFQWVPIQMWRADEHTGSGRWLTGRAETCDTASSPGVRYCQSIEGGVAVGASPGGSVTEYENTYRRWDDGA